MDMSGAKGVPIGTLLTLLSGGANIYPAEIEAAIEQHPSVRSCVVVGLPDDDMGQVTHAIIDIADPVASPLDTDALLLFLRDLRLGRA